MAGGSVELTTSAGGFSTRHVALLKKMLNRYNERKVWSAAGWLLQQFQEGIHARNDYLKRLDLHRPLQPVYVPRHQRDGVLSQR